MIVIKDLKRALPDGLYELKDGGEAELLLSQDLEEVLANMRFTCNIEILSQSTLDN